VEWLAPAGLSVAALLAPLVVLYILKVQRRRRRVASIWLWQAARRDLLARSPFQRLIVQIPLVLQALALLALAVGAARPATRAKELSGEHIAVIIDTSASMSALDPATKKSRIDLARQAAAELVLGLRPGADAMLVDAGRDARVAVPPDRDVRRLRAGVEAIRAHDVEGDLGAAVALAASKLQQLGGSRSIVVLTDGALARPLTVAGAGVPVEIVRVGGPVDNTAIVRLDVRAGRDPALGTEQVQAFLIVSHQGGAPVDRYVTMRERNASDVLDSRKIRLEPGATEPVILTFHPTPGDYGQGLIFELSPHDAMAVDDRAFGRVPVGRALPVLHAAAADRSPWLARALVADPDVELRSVAVGQLAGEALADPGSLVVVEGACPAELPSGDVLVVDPPAGLCHGTVVGEPLEKLGVTSWDHASPRLRFLSLDGVFIASARRLEPESRAQELIRTDRGVVATDISSSARSATLLGFDPGDSNWPLRASFVLFVRNLIEQARLHRSAGLAGPARSGDPLRVLVPSAATDAELTLPDETTRVLAARGGLAIVPEASTVGLYRISWSKPVAGSVLVPVNLTSAAESDLRTPQATGDDPAVRASEASSAIAAHHDWAWLLALAALALVVLDVWYLTRSPRQRSLAPTAARPRPPERRRSA
jgi:hypothetical protein